MYSILARHILYPIAEKFTGTKLMKYLNEFEDTQWWSPQQLRELQNEKLRALIIHAYENVPYYRRIFDERGLSDRDIQTVEDLKKLPILTKDDIRQNAKDMLAKDFQQWKPIYGTTGGSTGTPLECYTTMDGASVRWAVAFRGWGWAGYKIGDKRAHIGGTSIGATTQLDLKKRVRFLIERVMPISTYILDEERIALYIRKLTNYKPKFIYGYASAIYMLAEYLTKYKIINITPIAIFTTAETLLPYYRMSIEKAFHCKVFDCYGCGDGGAQAYECPTHNGYHLAIERAIIEFIDTNNNIIKPGQTGDIISTDLHNYAMPFIRYNTGDMGALAETHCSCGRGLTLMKSIEGRILDFILLPNGNKIRGLRLIDLFYEHIGGGYIKELSTIKQFQLIQNKQDELIVRIVQGAAPTDDEIDYLKSELVKALMYPMDIKFEFVDMIEQTKNAKRKFIISNL